MANENILIFYKNSMVTATLTPSSTTGQFTAENLKDSLRTKVWTTAGGVTAGSASLQMRFGTTQTFNAIILANHSWTSVPEKLNVVFSNATGNWERISTRDVTGKFRVDLTGATTFAPSIDTFGNQNVICKIFTATQYQCAMLDVDNTVGDWDLGQIWLGRYFEPDFQALENYKETLVDPSIVQQTPGGQRYADIVPKHREVAFTYTARTHGEWRNIQQMYHEVGISKDLFISFDYTNYASEMTLYGKFTSMVPMTFNKNRVMDFTFRESR